MAQPAFLFTPHPSAVTETGHYGYYSQAGRDPLPYAVCEFIDNSLAATAGNPSRGLDRRIDLRLIESADAGWYLIVHDNGSGMPWDQLREFATYGLSPATRGLRDSLPPELVEKDELFATGRISQFGVGSKQAAFYLADQLTVVTRAKDTVLELNINKKELERRYDQGDELLYSDQVRSRAPGAYSASRLPEVGLHDPYLQSLVEAEADSPHFTLLILSDLDPAKVTGILLEPASFIERVARVYNYYLTTAEITFTITSEQLSVCQSLAKVPNLETRYQAQEPKGVFSFTLVLGDSTDESTHRFVKGVLYYFPYLVDRETMPLLAEDELDEDLDRSESMFSTFWQGRLIPYTTVGPLAFMRTGGCLSRLRGSLFLSDSFPVTQNKLTFTQDLEKELQPYTVHIDQTYPKINPRSKFKGWLDACQRHLDKEFVFSDPVDGSLDPDAQWYATCSFPSAERGEAVIRAGDTVIVRAAKKKQLAGVVAHFVVRQVDGRHTSLPEAAVVYAPAEIYGPDLHLHKLNSVLRDLGPDQVARQAEALHTALYAKFPCSIQVPELPTRLRAGDRLPELGVRLRGQAGASVVTHPVHGAKKYFVVKKVILRMDKHTPVVVEEDLNAAPLLHAEDKQHTYYFYDHTVERVGAYQCVVSVENVALAPVVHEFTVEPSTPAVVKPTSSALTLVSGVRVAEPLGVAVFDAFGNTCEVPGRPVLSSTTLQVVDVKHTASGVLFAVLRRDAKDPSTSHRLVVRVPGVPDASIAVTLKFSPAAAMALINRNQVMYLLPGLSNACTLPPVPVALQLIDAQGHPVPHAGIDYVVASLAPKGRLSGLALIHTPVTPAGRAEVSIASPSLPAAEFLDRASAPARLLLRAYTSKNKPAKGIPPVELEFLLQASRTATQLRLLVSPQSEINSAPSEINSTTATFQVEDGGSFSAPAGASLHVQVVPCNEAGAPVTPDESFACTVSWSPAPVTLLSDAPALVLPVQAGPLALTTTLNSLSMSCTCRVEPGPATSFSLSLSSPCHLGTPLGQALQLTLLDAHSNPCAMPDSLYSRIQLSIQPESGYKFTGTVSTLHQVDPCTLVFPDLSVSGAPGSATLTASDTTGELPPCTLPLELLPGAPHHLSVSIPHLSLGPRTRLPQLKVFVCDALDNLVEPGDLTVQLHPGSGNRVWVAGDRGRTKKVVAACVNSTATFSDLLFDTPAGLGAEVLLTVKAVSAPKLKAAVITGTVTSAVPRVAQIVLSSASDTVLRVGHPFPRVGCRLVDASGAEIPVTPEMSLSATVLGKQVYSFASGVLSSAETLTKSGKVLVTVNVTDARPELVDLYTPAELKSRNQIGFEVHATTAAALGLFTSPGHAYRAGKLVATDTSPQVSDEALRLCIVDADGNIVPDEVCGPVVCTTDPGAGPAVTFEHDSAVCLAPGSGVRGHYKLRLSSSLRPELAPALLELEYAPELSAEQAQQRSAEYARVHEEAVRVEDLTAKCQVASDTVESLRQQLVAALDSPVLVSTLATLSMASTRDITDESLSRALLRLRQGNALTPCRTLAAVERKFARTAGFVGVIGHMAFAADATVALLASHRLRDKLRVPVVTYRGSEADLRAEAEDLERLLLDTVARPSGADALKLPHERKRLRMPDGAPVPEFMVRLLTPRAVDEDTFARVFGRVVGRTLVMDTLDQAVGYCSWLVAKGYKDLIPDIFTRDLQIARGGFIGGKGNRVPGSQQVVLGVAPDPSVLAEIDGLVAAQGLMVDVEEIRHRLETATAAADHLKSQLAKATNTGLRPKKVRRLR